MKTRFFGLTSKGTSLVECGFLIADFGVFQFLVLDSHSAFCIPHSAILTKDFSNGNGVSGQESPYAHPSLTFHLDFPEKVGTLSRLDLNKIRSYPQDGSRLSG
jgi:hypothetical protein